MITTRLFAFKTFTLCELSVEENHLMKNIQL
jgi:hypothetical protein